jgi:hypothetical protein
LVRSTVTWAPRGAWVSRCRTSASGSPLGSASGTIRIDSLALASGIRTLEARSTEVMSTPIALMDGLDHRREPIVPVPNGALLAGHSRHGPYRPLRSLVPAGVRIRRWPAQLASRRGLAARPPADQRGPAGSMAAASSPAWRTVKASMIWEKPLKM